MKRRLLVTALLFVVAFAKAQNTVIPLYPGAAPGSEAWVWDEKESDSNMFKMKEVYNVSHPTLTVYPADPGIANGTAVIICPGGGFHILAINMEGIDVARWLNAKGVTCFILKYRLVHSVTNDPVMEMAQMLGGDQKKFAESIASVVAMATSDTKTAIAYLRKHAVDYGIAPDRIGIIGFSAGGTLAAASAFGYTPENRPDFVAPIYPYVPDNADLTVAKDAPPMFIAAAADDNLRLYTSNIRLYNAYLAAGKSIEMHLYEKGGHGFGMNKQKLTTDTWIDRYGDWLNQLGLLVPEGLNPFQLADYKTRFAEKQWGSDWPFLKRFKQEDEGLEQAGPVKNRVVFLGNSITEGWLRVDSAYFAGRPYVNRGISGQTTPQMLIRFRQDVINLKPAAVVILAGTNDIAGNTGPTTLEDIYNNLVSMAELAKANKIKVVISSILPVFDYPWKPGLQPADKIAQLNQMLKDYADKNGCIYLDYYSTMVDARKGLPSSLSPDGVHPNLAGYRVMEPLAEKAIAKALAK